MKSLYIIIPAYNKSENIGNAIVPRQGGASMYNWGRIFRIGWNSLKEFASINRIIDQGVRDE